jgi:ornithine cyclodeaminase/alanine dehydrogenase
MMSMDDVIDVVENGFKGYMQGKYTLPLRGSAPVKEGVASFYYMPVYTADRDTMAVKMLSISGKGVWLVMALFVGQGEANAQGQEERPLVVMSGGWVTAMRTGAVSGVAGKYLAREDSEVVGMFGAGKQARTQLEAVTRVRDIVEARIHDPYLAPDSTFFAEMRDKLGIKVISVATPKDAVKGCDIVLTATSSSTPVFDGSWLESGTHVSAIGAHHGSGRKELDATTITASKLVVDQRKACLAEAGDIIDPIADGVITESHIYAELGELIMGQKPGRTSDNEITVFKSVGIAVQDIATAIKAYDLAKKKGVGVDIPDF